ncbi:hypothetical protein E1A91_A01G225900v1 [Gossypium mustelinum]|uniref:DUF868 domain-containing protein n=1 Tax=Gossypium mustelinum TaxID=34275 RepID=A0A5D3AGD8_GOSMU|nr:hypothetical protein E1A91_A01G225900v1 [Gossypium mustelinum]
MRSITSCYIEKAIKVSDSYCSWPSINQAYISPNHVPSTPNTITCIYKAKTSPQTHLFITLTWCNISQGLSIKVSDNLNRISESYHLKNNKGNKGFKACNSEIEVIWDVSNAEFINGSPEPNSKYSLIVLVDSRICFILGDNIDEQHEKADPSFNLISRTETFIANTVYSTKARFCESGLAHDILIKCCNGGELCVSIDKKEVFQVKRLKWNFRGNQIIFLDGLLVDMMWDLHDWVFKQTNGRAVFMFRTRSGFDSRLWLEEKSGCLEHSDKGRGHEFSLLICACKNPR